MSADDPRVGILAEALGAGFAQNEYVAREAHAEARDLLARLDAVANPAQRVEDEQAAALEAHCAHDDPDSAAAAYDLGRLHALGRALAIVKAAAS